VLWECLSDGSTWVSRHLVSLLCRLSTWSDTSLLLRRMSTEENGLQWKGEPTVSLYIKRGKVSVRTYIRPYVRTLVHTYVRSYVHNAGRGQLSSEWRHNKNSWLSRRLRYGTGRMNDIIMRMTSQWADLWRYGDWRHVATGCDALVSLMSEKKWSVLIPFWVHWAHRWLYQSVTHGQCDVKPTFTFPAAEHCLCTLTSTHFPSCWG